MSEIVAHACRLLARREYSTGELRRKLEKKWPDAEGIDLAIERLLQEGMLSDSRFAASFVRSRAARFQGPRKIRAELSGRSVAETDIQAALDGIDRSWADLASAWLARQGVDASDCDTRARYYRRLVNRGFTHDQAMDALHDRLAVQQDGDNAHREGV